MLIPVRCFTCNKVLGNKENSIKSLQKEGMEMDKIMDTLKIERICCRRILLTYIDLSDDLFKYQNPPDHVELYDGVKKLRIYDAI